MNTTLSGMVKARPRASNISIQSLATSLDRVTRCCEGAGQTSATFYNIQKCCTKKKLTIFEPDPIHPTYSFFKKKFLNHRLSICNKQRGVVRGGAFDYFAGGSRY